MQKKCAEPRKESNNLQNILEGLTLRICRFSSEDRYYMQFSHHIKYARKSVFHQLVAPFLEFWWNGGVQRF
jgi:hypothetical protein